MTDLERKEYQKQYRLENKERIKEKRMQYYEKNKKIILEKNKEYTKENKEQIITYQKKYKKEYHCKNKEKLLQENKKYREVNKEKIKKKSKKYREENKEHNKEYYQKNKKQINDKKNKYHKNKIAVDVLFKLKCNTGDLIRVSIRNNGYTKKSRTFEILGCTYEEFKQHIERQFAVGMSWDNRSEWHLDHIYPISLAKNELDVIKLNHYTNFQPLWIIDNLLKGNKVIANTQIKLV
jgi:hypothetical protein